MQRAVQECHVAVRRDDVAAVRLHHHSIFDLKDLHTGVASDEVGQDALMVRRQMLDQYKGHSRINIGRHSGKKGLKGMQSAG